MKTPGRGRRLFLRVIRSSITIVLQFFPRAAGGGEVGLFAAEFAPLTTSLEHQNPAFPVVPKNSKDSYQLSAVSLIQKPDQLTAAP